MIGKQPKIEKSSFLRFELDFTNSSGKLIDHNDISRTAMNYIVKLNDTEYGPVDELTLAKWIEEDRIVADTDIRSEMIEVWSKASEMPSLEEALAEQKKRMIRDGLIDPNAKKEPALIKLIHVIWGRKITKPFEMGYKPCYTKFGSRFNAFCFDGLILLIIFVAICTGGLYYGLTLARTTTEQAPLAKTDNLKIRLELRKKEQQQKIAGDTAAVPKADPDSNEALLRESLTKARKARENAMNELRDKFGEDFTEFKKGNFEAQTPPTVYADRSAGYRRGYLWVNTADGNKRYICLNAQEGDALWLEASDLKLVFTLAAMVFLPILLLYYIISFGYYAQTPGMWFYGIFICCRHEAETYFFRAFCYTLFMFVFGFLTPLFVPFFKRGLHDMFCGVYVYNVVAGSSNPQ